MTLTLITGTTGQTITARLAQGSGFVGNAIACPESPAGSGRYTGTPAGFAEGFYDVLFYSGGTLSGGVLTGGTLAGFGPYAWDGTQEVTPLQLAARTWAHVTRSLTDKSGFSLAQSFPPNFALLGINASGHVQRVTLVDTTTANTDMRGTNNALLASNYTSPPSTSAIALEVQTQLSDEFDAIPTASENATAVAGGLASEFTDLATLVGTRSSFDPNSDRVDIRAVQGVPVVSIADFRTDVSGIPSAVDTALADNFTALANAIANIPAPPDTGAIATAVDSALADNFALLASAINLLPDLADIEGSNVLAKDATLTTLVPVGAIARIDTYTTRRSKLEGFATGVTATFTPPNEIAATPGSIVTSDGSINVAIALLPNGVRRVQPGV